MSQVAAQVFVAILLGVAVVATWLGAAAFLRLKSPLERLHCIAFVNIAAGLPIVAAAFVTDGFSTRAFKFLALLVVTLVAGAAVNQMLARAILARSGEPGETA